MTTIAIQEIVLCINDAADNYFRNKKFSIIELI